MAPITSATLTSYSDFAAVARRLHADELASVLEQARPGMPFAPVALTDTRATLTKFRRVLEEHAGVDVIGNQLGGGWSYQPSGEPQLSVYGFVELSHAILAAVRSVVAPLTLDQKLLTRRAKPADLRWLLGLSGSDPQLARQRGRFYLLEECRAYSYLPQAGMLMQCFREPTEFAPDATALAGYTFFGNSIVAVIETLYQGGGWQMMQWLLKRHERLIVHDVLNKHAQTFFERQGFVHVHLPFPPEAHNRARDMVIMAWPAEGKTKRGYKTSSLPAVRRGGYPSTSCGSMTGHSPSRNASTRSSTA